jgi:pimeloyl-ACP methyl ester carboxylesterase
MAAIACAVLAFAPLSPTAAHCRAVPVRTSQPAMLAKGNLSRDGSKRSSEGRSSSNAMGDGDMQPPRSRLRNRLAVGGLIAASAGGGAVMAARQKRTLPVVVVHGVLSSCIHMEEVADWAQAAVGSRGYVRCIEVGNGEVDSITRPMEWQLAELARKIQADPELRRGFHMIGHSQGTLLSRAFVQRYDWPQVHSLISWVGPQAGQFGVPTYEPLLGYLNRVTSGMWYAPQLQSARPSSRTLSFANYWRDPTKLEVYRANSGFLADINNERPLKNASYAARLLLERLDHPAGSVFVVWLLPGWVARQAGASCIAQNVQGGLDRAARPGCRWQATFCSGRLHAHRGP